MALIFVHGKKDGRVAQTFCCKKHNSTTSQPIIISPINVVPTSLSVCILPGKNDHRCCVSMIFGVMEQIQIKMFTTAMLSFKKLLARLRKNPRDKQSEVTWLSINIIRLNALQLID